MKHPAVLPVTLKGKILCMLLRWVYSLYCFFARPNWKYPLRDFEEDPLHMSTRDAIYLGYKYYIRPHREASEASGLEHYFRRQHIDFALPADFEEKQRISLHAGGDLMPYKLVNSGSTRQLWQHCGDFFFGADMVFANLETPIRPGKKEEAVPEVMLNDMYFNGSAEMFDIFNGAGKYRGYDVLSIANNHSMDMGKKGLLKTMEFLRERNIVYCGAVEEATGLANIPMLERKGIKTAFLAYTFSLNKMLAPKGKEWMLNHLRLNQPGCDIALIREQCRQARKKGADFIVVSLHGGNAYQAYPSAHTVDLFHRIFEECGADIILGGHPHNIQPLEKYPFKDPFSGEEKEGFAIYSLGDFVAYDIFTWCHLPMMLELQLSKGTRQGITKACISGIRLMPVYNYYNRKERSLQFIPFLQALENRQQFEPHVQKELQELEDFFYKYFLPEKHEHLLLRKI